MSRPIAIALFAVLCLVARAVAWEVYGTELAPPQACQEGKSKVTSKSLQTNPKVKERETQAPQSGDPTKAPRNNVPQGTSNSARTDEFIHLALPVLYHQPSICVMVQGVSETLYQCGIQQSRECKISVKEEIPALDTKGKQDNSQKRSSAALRQQRGGGTIQSCLSLTTMENNNSTSTFTYATDCASKRRREQRRIEQGGVTQADRRLQGHGRKSTAARCQAGLRQNGGICQCESTQTCPHHTCRSSKEGIHPRKKQDHGNGCRMESIGGSTLHALSNSTQRISPAERGDFQSSGGEEANMGGGKASHRRSSHNSKRRRRGGNRRSGRGQQRNGGGHREMGTDGTGRTNYPLRRGRRDGKGKGWITYQKEGKPRWLQGKKGISAKHEIQSSSLEASVAPTSFFKAAHWTQKILTTAAQMATRQGQTNDRDGQRDHQVHSFTNTIYALLGILLGKGIARWFVWRGTNNARTEGARKVRRTRYNDGRHRHKRKITWTKIAMIYLWGWQMTGAQAIAQHCLKEELSDFSNSLWTYREPRDDTYADPYHHGNKASSDDDHHTKGKAVQYTNKAEEQNNAKRNASQSQQSDPQERLNDEPELRELQQRVWESMRQEQQENRQRAQHTTRLERHQEVWLEIQALIHQDDARQFGVRMYGIKNIHQDTRTRSTSLEEIRDRVGFLTWVRHQWMDMTEPHDLVHLHYVTPQPSPHIVGRDVLHLIVDMLPVSVGIPILFALRHIYNPQDNGLYVFLSHRATAWLSHEEATRVSSTNVMCSAPPNSCRSWVEMEYLTDARRVRTYNGLLWTIDIYLYDVDPRALMNDNPSNTGIPEAPQESAGEQVNEDSQDEMAMPQIKLRSVSRTPPRDQRVTRYAEAHVFQLGQDDPQKVSLQDVPQNHVQAHVHEQLNQLQRADLGRPQTRFTIYEVRPNPIRLMSQGALGFLKERLEDQRANQVLIYIDIDVTPVGGVTTIPTAHRREIRYMSQRSDRRTFLREAGLGPFCMHTHDCLALVFGRAWEDEEEREHENGYYAMIHVSHPDNQTPFNELWERVQHGLPLQIERCTQRDIRRQLHGHSSSSDESPMLQVRQLKQCQTNQQQGLADETTMGQEDQENIHKDVKHVAEDDEERASLMQTGRPGRRSHEARLYRHGDPDYIFVQFPPDVGAQDYRRYIQERRTTNMNHEEAARILFHQVLPTPEDVVRDHATAYLEDDERRRPEEHRLVLVDVNVYPRSSNGQRTRPSDEWRAVEVVHQMSNRQQLVQDLQLDPWCQPHSPCIITVAGSIWPPIDPGMRPIFPGAYVIIDIWHHDEDSFSREWDRNQQKIRQQQ